MNATELKKELQKPYTQETWLSIAKDVFGKLSVLSKPVDIDYNKDFVKSFRQVGHVHLEDGKSLAMIEVKVDDTKDLYRNKVELRNLTTKLIDENSNHGVLVIYDNETGNYRFTFATKESVLNETTMQVETRETNPKRFTYLLGPGESCFTPAIQLSKLASKGREAELKDVVDAFNVEAVNKKFFNEYKEHYTAFVEYLNRKKYKSSVFNGDEKAIRDFAKKMLGRLVFLYFLQKKGWMGVPSTASKWEGGDPHFLKSLFAAAGKEEDFYPSWLVPLFQTLNEDKKGEVYKLPNGQKVKVPCLNGGLFEADGLKTEFLTFDPALFTALFEFFDQYNFTIYEDDPDERFLAVDPEMLGHIFENLLEDNKDKGAYYTPKEIVHYMCQESLVEYLHTSLTTKGETLERAALEKLVKQKSARQVADYDEAILKTLRIVKICDPAIGSGAFPIGLLHEIFDLVQLLHDLNPDVTEDVWQLKDGWNPAKVKEDIIQNSIYGVDIEKGAVEIARLRFWLSLVVDEEVPKPLPNLDYKIVVGDSLLSRFHGVVIDIEWNYTTSHGTAETKGIIAAQVGKLQTLQAWQEQYFKTKSGNKQKLQLDIRNLKIDILINQLKLSKLSFQQKNPKLGGFEPTLKEKQKNLENELVLKGYDKKVGKLEALKKDREVPLHFFDWKLDFPEVMNKKKGEGKFDIVIGNPPYIQMQKDGGLLADLYANRGFETYERTGDIYSLFYEKGFELLKDSGIHTFITSSQWTRAAYGKSLRTYFLKQNPITLLLLGPGIFENATVDTNILIAKKGVFENSLRGVLVKDRSELMSLKDTALIPMNYVSETAWSIVIIAKQTLNDKIKKFGKPLKDWKIKINRGILTGLNEAFIINEQKRKELIKADPKSKEVIKPILRGRDIDKYFTEWEGSYLINTHNGLRNGKLSRIEVNKYPSIKKYLDLYKDRLINRQDQGGTPYNLRNCAYLKEFENEKIIWKRIGSDLRFTYFADEIYSLDSTCIATGEKIKYLTALLNSKFCNYQLFEYAPRTGMGDLLISVQALEPLMVHYPTNAEEKIVVKKLDQILKLKQRNLDADTSDIEREIDILVYKMYELTYEEASIVEGDNEWMAKETYENFLFEKETEPA